MAVAPPSLKTALGQVALLAVLVAAIFVVVLLSADDSHVYDRAYIVEGELGPRLSIFATDRFVGRGGTAARGTLWTFDLREPTLVSTALASSKRSARVNRRVAHYLWVALEGEPSTYRYAAFDMYRGELSADVNAVAERIGERDGFGAFRIKGQPTETGVRVEFESGDWLWVTPNGGAHPAPPQLEEKPTLRLGGAPVKREVGSLQRAFVLPKNCGCTAGGDCGILTVHHEGPFGDGPPSLGLLRDHEFVWDHTFEALGLPADTKLVASHSHDRACLLITWSPQQRAVLWLTRETGQVPSRIEF